jgi:hypothetical protein
LSKISGFQEKWANLNNDEALQNVKAHLTTSVYEDEI